MQCIVFDFDGPLFDGRSVAKKALIDTFKKYGIVILEHTIDLLPLLNTQQLIKMLLTDFSNDFSQEQDILKSYRFILNKMEHGITINQKVNEVLDDLSNREDLILIIQTGRTNNNINSLLGTLEIRQFFNEVIGRDNFEAKPSPLAINYIKKKYNMKNENVVFIGDSDIDYLTAKNAGIKYIHAKFSSELINLSWKNADYIINSIEEVVESIDFLTKLN